MNGKWMGNEWEMDGKRMGNVKTMGNDYCRCLCLTFRVREAQTMKNAASTRGFKSI